ncbi:ExbD/TolR family protein [Persephonella sp.]
MNFRRFSRLDDNSNFIVDMTALVDIAFIIILFLGIVSTLAPISSINVELPKATAEKTSVEPLKVIVDKDGSYYIRNKKVTEDEIAQYIKSHTSKSLVIIADRRVQYGKVVKVMDIAKQNGIEEINIATRRGK